VNASRFESRRVRRPGHSGPGGLLHEAAKRPKRADALAFVGVAIQRQPHLRRYRKRSGKREIRQRQSFASDVPVLCQLSVEHLRRPLEHPFATGDRRRIFLRSRVRVRG
jgi:hypothetical protein